MTAGNTYAQEHGVTAVQDITNILPERQRAEIMNRWLEWRLENLIPDLMRREGIDMWLVICREYNEDPVYMSLVPEPNMSARRTSILIFHDRGPAAGVERLTGSFYDMGTWYSSIYKDRNKDQFETLAEFIKERNPQKIGINISEAWAFGDGLTASFKEKLENALGERYSSRLVSAEHLCIGWLETRSPEELSVYRHICGIAHDIIAEFFSNEVIIPDITTTEEVVWWIRQKITGLGLKTWFQPSIDIQRNREEAAKYKDNNTVIRRGDLLHCDIGIVYLGLCTDTQQMAYVCKTGENDVPEDLKEALRKANRLQDIFMGEFKVGRTGNEILLTSLKKAKDEGLQPSIYTHPLGVYGHAAGPTIGLWDRQEGVPVRGDYPLYVNTCYAIELNNRYSVPEWDNQEVRIALEEGGVFTEEGCNFIDGRMTKFYLIK
ncbi:hypothetical protein AMJ80_04955 [bacterium SM23_31]|nr:MAG: hypothetical protein AMJ80_04955 [bacterium SM23_31]